jgi:energy-coupling factor transport system permease protein
MTRGRTRPARALHPVAWWLWALGLVAAASRTLNPVLLVMIIAVAALVVSARKGDAPWSGSFRAFLVLGVVVLGVRLAFEVLFGAPIPGTVAFTLPEATLPSWMAGVRLGGPVTVEALVAALYSGLQLVAILACVGAANALANPTRLLKSVPGALYEIAVAVVVALTLVPSALAHLQQIRDARRLRGVSTRGRRAIGQMVTAVLAGSLERSLALAAAMDSRGFGRLRPIPRRERRITALITGTGVVLLLAGTYSLLDAGTPPQAAAAAIVGSVALLFFGLRRANRRAVRSVYRPDPWRAPESLTVAVGVLAATSYAVAAATDPLAMTPATSPLTWPTLPALAALGTLLAATPAVMAPPPVTAATTKGPEPRSVPAPVREVAAA